MKERSKSNGIGRPFRALNEIVRIYAIMITRSATQSETKFYAKWRIEVWCVRFLVGWWAREKQIVCMISICIYHHIHCFFSCIRLLNELHILSLSQKRTSEHWTEDRASSFCTMHKTCVLSKTLWIHIGHLKKKTHIKTTHLKNNQHPVPLAATRISNKNATSQKLSSTFFHKHRPKITKRNEEREKT